MFLIELVLAVLVVLWFVRDYLHWDVTKNFGDGSVPITKNSFNLALLKPDEIFQYPRQCAKVFKKTYISYIFGITHLDICRAKDAERILGSSKHLDKSYVYKFTKLWVKNGLVTSRKEIWQPRRKLLAPAFHNDILKDFFEIYSEEADRVVDELKKNVGRAVEIAELATRFTLNAICETSLGVNLRNQGSSSLEYSRNLEIMKKMMVHRLAKPWLFSDALYMILGYRKEFEKVLLPIHKFSKEIITERRKIFESNSTDIGFDQKKRRFAMLDTFLQAQRSGLIDDAGVLEETDTFIAAGHDTMASAFTFILLLLAHHPEAQEMIFDEIQEILNENSELRYEALNKLDYLNRSIKECLRIYPPVPYMARELAEDFLHEHVTLPKGTSCHIHIFDVHRDPEVFPDPEKFDPDRFLPENCAKRHNYAYIPFSAGMRNCIGQKSSIMEIKVIVAKILHNFKLKPITTREELVFVADIVLRTQNAVEIEFIERTQKKSTVW